MYFFPDLELVCWSVSSSNCCFLTFIQVSQEAGKVVWYSHLFKCFPQFVVIHTVKDFGIVNKAEVTMAKVTQNQASQSSIPPLPANWHLVSQWEAHGADMQVSVSVATVLPSSPRAGRDHSVHPASSSLHPPPRSQALAWPEHQTVMVVFVQIMCSCHVSWVY